MPRSTRLFEIIQILRRATAPITAQAIADTLEVTKRTVYRDMAALQAMRLPIAGEAGIGYMLRADLDLPLLTFDADELEAIVVGLALLGRTGDTGLQGAARRAAGKIADVAPQETPGLLHVSQWHTIAKPVVGYDALRRFIREEAELAIHYLDLQDQRTERTIRPLGLIYYIDAVVLAAWCDLRQGFRHFRVDRIETCRPTGHHFTGTGAALRDAWQRDRSEA